MENFNQIKSDLLNKIKNVSNRNGLVSVKTEIFGKKGVITELFKKIENLNQSQRKEYASKLNDLKTKIVEVLEKKLVNFDQSEINKKLKNEKVDNSYRKSIISWIPFAKAIPIYQIIGEWVSRINMNSFGFDTVQLTERGQYAEYSKGGFL